MSNSYWTHPDDEFPTCSACNKMCDWGGCDTVGCIHCTLAVEAFVSRFGSKDVHKVKSWCYLYSAAIAGYKTHDFRDMTERDYKVNDLLHLCEFDQTKGEYTGREALFQITYITDRNTPCAMSSCALEKKYGVLSIKMLRILQS